MRMTIAVASLCLLIVGLASAGDAQAMARQSTSIPPQPLDSALRALARERGFHIVYLATVVNSKRTQGAAGELTQDEALTQLLSGTGLTFRYLDPETVTVVPTGAAASLSSGEERSVGPDSNRADTSGEGQAGRSFWDRFRLVQTNQGQTAADTPLGQNDSARPNEKNPPIKLEEVVVTAQKRKERLIDVPISIVAVSPDALQKRNMTSVDDLPHLVPGLAIETVGWQRRIQLRGIGNGQGLFSLIGMYLDEAAVTTTGVSQLDLSTYDLERVEVLRGPQGTLYGEGSAGGTLRFITKNPALNSFLINADVGALFTEYGAPSQNIDVMVNVPIVTDQLGVRIAGSFDHGGGWMDQPAVGKNDFNGQNRVDVRVKTLWQPTQEFTANAMAVIHRNNGSTNIGEDANGNYTQTFGQPTTPKVEDNYNLYNLTLSYDFRAVRALNTSSYVDQDRQARNFGYIFVSNPGVPISNFYFTPYEPINRILTDELRFSSNDPGPWQWTAGGLYRHAQLRLIQRYYFGVPGTPGTLPRTQVNGDSDTLSESWAAFGDTSYKFVDRLTVGAGLRYFHDDQTFTTTSTQRGSFHSLSPRAYVQYKVAKNFNVYANAAKGFRSGGFNALNRPSYGPEDIRTYELGTKMALLDGRLGVDIASFYSTYKNYQIAGVVPSLGLNITSNAGDARIRGIEWQFTGNPSDNWAISFNGDYIHTRFQSIVVTKSAFAVGDPLPFIPDYQLTGSVERTFAIYDKRSFFRLDYDLQGRMNTRNRSLGTLYYGESDVIHMLDLDAGIQMNESLMLSVFARNVLNDRGFIDPYTFIHDAARERPRTYGVKLNLNF